MKIRNIFATSFVLVLSFYGIVNGNNGKKPAHLCDAEGESSEECDSLNNVRLQGWFDPLTTTPVPQENTVVVKFRLYKTVSDFVEIEPTFESIKNAEPFQLANQNNNDTKVQWKVLIPGFPLRNYKSPFPNNVIKAYFQRMRFENEKHNILVVDWDRAACVSPDEIYYGVGKTYTEEVGNELAKLLTFLQDINYLNLNTDVHLIGFSLGAHVAGEAARTIFQRSQKHFAFFAAKHHIIYRLTALDPANRKFWSGLTEYLDIKKPAPFRRAPAIRRSFVAFLDAYHTSSDYGIKKHLGDIDFYPNDAKVQNGCDISEKKLLGLWGKTRLDNFQQLCSHMYATELFARSINDMSMLACTGCEYWDLYDTDNDDKCQCEDKVILGEDVDRKKYNGYPMASGTGFIKPTNLGNFGENFMKRLESHGEPRFGHRGWRQMCD